MKKRFAYPLSVVLLTPLLSMLLFAQSSQTVSDGDRSIPVSYDADVLIVGGTTEAVAAAVEAAKAGARTMLVTDVGYLGDDLTATLRLWKPIDKSTDPLVHDIYDDAWTVPGAPDAGALLARKDRIDYTYTIEEPINKKHAENKTNNRLSDGVIGTIQTDSLQTDAPMTIRLDLGEPKEIGSIVFAGFHRAGLCAIYQVTVFFSEDGNSWKELGIGERMPGMRPAHDKPDFHVLKPRKDLKARYWKVYVTPSSSSRAIFAAELLFFRDADAANSLLPKNEEKVDMPPRPLHVKRVLDKALLDNDVQFLYGAYESGRILDASGKSSGILISNRAGRQGIVAKKVVDMRDRSQSALEKLAASNAATATVEFIVIGGEAVEVETDKYSLIRKASCETLDQKYVGPKSRQDQGTIVPYGIHRYLFEIERDFALAAFGGDIAKYEMLIGSIRLATFHPQQQFTADRISLLGPEEKLFEYDEKRLKAARKLGREAGEAAKSLPKPTDSPQARTLRAETGVDPITAQKGKPVPGTVEEPLGGIRPYEEQLGYVQLPGAAYEVAGEYDVLVIGGGTTGAPAGIAAARAGAKTLVVELQSELGGVGTLGSINGYYHGNKVGFTAEVLGHTRGWVASHKSNWWATELKKAGGEVWYGVLGAGAVVDPTPVDGRRRVKGALLATPFGPKVVLAKVVIDTTGNGDIARAAGSDMEFTTKDEITVQGTGLSPLGLGNYRMNNDYTYIDDTDPVDVTHAYVYGKVKYPTAFDQGKVIGTRERRRIVGDFVITALDQLNLRTYDDSIARSWSDFDSHGYTTSTFLELYHPKKREAYFTYYPYRASLPTKLEGILVGALATSAHRDALPMTRMQADLQNQGYALGYIAATVSKDATEPVQLRKVDIRKVQRHLVEIGNLPESVLTETDNYEASKTGLVQAVAELPTEAKNALLVMWHPADSLPLLKIAFEKATDPEAKAVYARALALLGDGSGESLLLDRVKTHDGWDPGWNFKGMSQFGSPSSQLDKDIMMLGRLKCKAAVPVIVQKLNELKATDDFSHHRACYLALEWIGDPAAASALAAHLKKPDMTGYAHRTIDDAIRADKNNPNINLGEKSRRDSLREIGAARALYRLGDHEEIGRKILEAYSKDLRGHFARHAAEELKRNDR